MPRSRTARLLSALALTACSSATLPPTPATSAWVSGSAPAPAEKGYPLHLNMCGWIVAVQGAVYPVGGEVLWTTAGCGYVRGVP
jgi:hypothetical protein